MWRRRRPSRGALGAVLLVMATTPLLGNDNRRSDQAGLDEDGSAAIWCPDCAKAKLEGTPEDGYFCMPCQQAFELDERGRLRRIT